MYTVSKGPSKIVAKTRRGLTQNYEKFETIKESSKRNGDLNSPEKINVPRPVFQTMKKSAVPARVVEETVITPQHEEIIRYINDSWNIIVAHNPYDTTCKAAQADRNNNSTNTYNNNSVSSIASASTSSSSTSSTNSSSHCNGNATTTTTLTTNLGLNGNSSTNGYNGTPSASNSMYCIEPPSPVLSDFKPFDLESWWGRRLFNNITKSL